jgi:trans-aconitate methyltransferase
MHKTVDTWNAQYYKQHSESQLQRGLSTVQSLTLRGDEVALDVGCGDGRITIALAKRLPQGSVLGLDLSENMINEAKKSFGDVLNVSFVNDNIITFTTNKRFDVVVSFGTFHWIPDQLGAFKSIFSLLKPGGLVVVKIGAERRSGPSLADSPKWKPLLAPKGQRWFPQTTEHVLAILEACGFMTIDVRYEERTTTYPNQEALFDWLMGWVPHSTGLPLEQAQAFARDMVAAMVKEQGRSQNIQRSGRTVVAIARKPA